MFAEKAETAKRTIMLVCVCNGNGSMVDTQVVATSAFSGRAAAASPDALAWRSSLMHSSAKPSPTQTSLLCALSSAACEASCLSLASFLHQIGHLSPCKHVSFLCRLQTMAKANPDYIPSQRISSLLDGDLPSLPSTALHSCQATCRTASVH